MLLKRFFDNKLQNIRVLIYIYFILNEIYKYVLS